MLLATFFNLERLLFERSLQLGDLKSKTVSFSLNILNFLGEILVFFLKLLKMLFKSGYYKFRLPTRLISFILLRIYFL